MPTTSKPAPRPRFADVNCGVGAPPPIRADAMKLDPMCVVTSRGHTRKFPAMKTSLMPSSSRPVFDLIIVITVLVPRNSLACTGPAPDWILFGKLEMKVVDRQPGGASPHPRPDLQVVSSPSRSSWRRPAREISHIKCSSNERLVQLWLFRPRYGFPCVFQSRVEQFSPRFRTPTRWHDRRGNGVREKSTGAKFLRLHSI